MWIYLKTKQEPGVYLYTVGFFEPGNDPGYRAKFHADQDFATADAARARVNYLNGGNGDAEGAQ